VQTGHDGGTYAETADRVLQPDDEEGRLRPQLHPRNTHAANHERPDHQGTARDAETSSIHIGHHDQSAYTGSRDQSAYTGSHASVHSSTDDDQGPYASADHD
jgi:hypothetical protein